MPASIYTRNKNFIKRAKSIHNHKYDYSLVKYKNAHTKIQIICPEHGIFEQTPNGHIAKKGCSLCSNNITITTDEWIKRAKLLHTDKYDYSLVKYNNAHAKVKIICTHHGIFEQTPNHHVHGNQCPECANKHQTGLYNSTALNRDPELANKDSTLYLIQYENLYKIGITTVSVYQRFNKQIKIISQLNNIPLIDSFNKEQEILEKYVQFKEYPKNWTHGGDTEFLNINNEQLNKIIIDYFT